MGHATAFAPGHPKRPLDTGNGNVTNVHKHNTNAATAGDVVPPEVAGDLVQDFVAGSDVRGGDTHLIAAFGLTWTFGNGKTRGLKKAE